MIKLSNVDKSFDDNLAVDDLSLTIGKSEIVGFLGPNGAGKTTTMRMITGYLTPDSGSISIDGLDVIEHSVESKRKIGYLPENNPLYHDLLVSEALDLIADLRGIPKKDRDDLIDKAVAQTGLASVYYKPIGDLSKGYKQRTGLAQAILHEPEILILDEPTEGLDPNQRVEVRELIRRIGEDKTVIVSTHILQEIRSIASRLLIINNGRLIADGTVDDILSKASTGTQLIVEIEGKGVMNKIKGLPGVLSVDLEKTENRMKLTISVDAGTELRPIIFDLAKDCDWRIWELHQQETNLEDIFRELTVRASMPNLTNTNIFGSISSNARTN